MGDVKLFSRSASGIQEIHSETVLAEKTLQSLFENNLDALLGVRFLATEFSTGPVHGGRMDTLGLDEDGSPVIIEYKRSLNQNVMNQGLFYLDWLLDHKGDFQLLVAKVLGSEAANSIDWTEPRLICIAGDFTRYDEHAVKQMSRNIELLRYRRYGDELLLIELVHAPNFAKNASKPKALADELGLTAAKDEKGPSQGSIAYRISKTSGTLKELFESTCEYLESLGDDVQVNEKRMYVAFKRIKNFACVEVYPQVGVVTVFLKLDPKNVPLEEGFTKDMSSTGHYGTGNFQVTLKTTQDLAKAQPLFDRSYESS